MVGGFRVPGELRRDCSATSGDSRSDRASGNSENLGDLGVVERADVSEHDCGAELGRKCGEGCVDGQPVADTAGEVMGTGGRPDELVHRERASPAPAQFVETRVGRHPVRPGDERRTSVEARQASDNSQECLLCGVRRVGVVSGHATAQPVQAVVVPAQQCVERRPVTRLSGGDEGDVVRSADGGNLLRLDADLRDLSMDTTR
jgi:hypothetical protein